jgi:hypothetical protein
VTEYEHLLRETFESHEHLAPSLGAVYNGSQVLFRRYMRRRRGARVVSGAVLGAGLIAGGTHLPAGLLPGAAITAPPAGVGATIPPATIPPATTPPATTPEDRARSAPAGPPRSSFSEQELDRQEEVFGDAGYDHEDAVLLARLWHSKDDILDVKAKAGRLLQAGRTLPIEPGGGPAEPESADQARKAEEAFFNAGYSYDDAVRLAAQWNLAGPSEAKIAGGAKLEAGVALPFPPE